MVENGCCGTCCERFTMNITPEQRSKSIAAELSDKKFWIDFLDDAYVYRRVIKDEFQSIQFIADMIIERPVREDGLRTYTCQHFDIEERICKIYDQRPGLCRRYPDVECHYEGCKFKIS